MDNETTIALYIRLSNDDGSADESNSVKNQRDLLRQYIAKNQKLSLLNSLEFIDDGYSGTNFERPGVKLLLEKVRMREVHCIIVKDFSRFGRNYIEVGDYLEKIFPFIGVRFISINDNYDSDTQEKAMDGIEVALKTLIYDLCSKDLSEKTKSGLDAKKRRGEFAAGRPPYGYIKSLVNKNKLEINEKDAKVVRYIFNLAAEGKSRMEIAKTLNELNIPVRSGKSGGFWKRSDISEIVENETYTGTAIANKRRRTAVGGKSVEIPAEDWTMVPNAHPAIISMDVYRKVNQNLKTIIRKNLRKDMREAHDNGVGSLKGLVSCQCCNYALRRNGVNPTKYYCETPWVRQSTDCVSEPVEESVLEEAVLVTLKNHINLFADITASRQKKESRGDNVKKPTVQHCNSISRLNSAKQVLYENFKDGMVSKNEYLTQKESINNQITKIKESISLLEDTLPASAAIQEQIHEKKDIWNDWHLTHKIVKTLVDAVIVYNSERIEIRLKYANPLFLLILDNF